jgi:predicted anti-sigma-YlaC factor YlaD
MPSKPEIEPTLEELSSYLDHELGPTDQTRVAEHVATCATCQERLAGLRQATYAIRGLPMESPPRSFANVLPRQRQWRWAPVGWVGSAAVAVVLLGIGLTHLPAGEAETASNTAIHANSGGGNVSGGLAYGAGQPVPAAGLAAPLDESKSAAAAHAQSLVNSTTVSDPRTASRSLTLAADATSYTTSGAINVRTATRGLSVDEANSIRLWLTRDDGKGGYAIGMARPTNLPRNASGWDAVYPISQMPLPAPVAGSYRLEAVVQLADGSALIAYLPVTIRP